MISRYLPQHPSFEPEDTVLTAIRKELIKVDETEGKGVDKTRMEWVSQVHTGWDVETETKTMLTKLGFTDFECGVLSGGQRKRLALVAADEPTNHLNLLKILMGAPNVLILDVTVVPF